MASDRQHHYLETRQDSGYIHTVSSLTNELKGLIEESYPFVWVTGEISNCTLPSSGHLYFALKDSDALINCVMFRNQKKRLIFNPENGMKITGIGRLSLYEPRGAYQLIFEYMETGGTGDLQIYFEKLKKKLALEGLFDEAHKKKLPFLPSKIAIITSPGGSVVRDIINISQRRFPGIHLEVVPVKVQGEGADLEIKRAIELVNQMANLAGKTADGVERSDIVIIIARGGGSLEDLATFNSETIARAVFESVIPIISAVGHETDFTICDLVADLRAPTPSAAAEIALPDKQALKRSICILKKSLLGAFQNQINILKRKRDDFQSRLKSPLSRVDDMRFRLEDLQLRLTNRITETLNHRQEKLDWFIHALYANNPQKKMLQLRQESEQLSIGLKMAMLKIVDKYRVKIVAQSARLEALSPMGVLERGYSITRRCDSGTILMNSADSADGDIIEVTLSMGKLICQVNKTV